MRFPLSPLIPILLITAAFTPDASAATVHVPADHPTIQSCIDAAISGQDECVVAPGTYNELINFLGKAVTLRSSHGPEVTTIDGTGLNGSVVTCASGEDTGSLLDGFTITGGMGTDIGGYRHGGGMYNQNSSPTVTNCTIQENSALIGGGMQNSGANPIVSSCIFRNNESNDGAGMNNISSIPIVTNSVFEANSGYNGGGMSNFYWSNSIVTDCKFNGNDASIGGGMHNFYSSPTIKGCSFNDNRAEWGGGVFNYEAPNVTMTSCIFQANVALLGDGGGLYSANSAPTIIRCTFISNKSFQRYGGGVSNDYSDARIIDCDFFGNEAYGGGGIFNNVAAPQIIGSKFERNYSR
jgi:hypothetical protein